MQRKNKTLDAIDRVLEERQGHGFRRHLGASIIGKECPRFIWYVFRWAFTKRAHGRMLRLWDRGNLEEDRIAKWLRQSGTHVVTRNPDTGEQFRVEDHHGHFGGSLDAKLFDAPDFPGIWILGEFKTHADKYFKELRKKVRELGPQAGLREAVVGYFIQAQIYMRYEQLPHCLHFNVNKNDDDMEVVTVEYDASVAEQYIDRAAKIIWAEVPPPRISNSPGWYKCRWCDARHVCHEGARKERNCRTCVNSVPIDNGDWLCRRYQYRLTEADQRRGCLDYMEIPE